MNQNNKRTDDRADKWIQLRPLALEELLVVALVLNVAHGRARLKHRVRVIPADDHQALLQNLCAHLHLRGRVHLHIGLAVLVGVRLASHGRRGDIVRVVKGTAGVRVLGHKHPCFGVPRPRQKSNHLHVRQMRVEVHRHQGLRRHAQLEWHVVWVKLVWANEVVGVARKDLLLNKTKPKKKKRNRTRQGRRRPRQYRHGRSPAWASVALT